MRMSVQKLVGDIDGTAHDEAALEGVNRGVQGPGSVSTVPAFCPSRAFLCARFCLYLAFFARFFCALLLVFISLLW